MKNTILILTILLTFVSCDTEVKSELQTGIIEGEDAKSLAVDGFNDAYLANDMTGQDALFTQDAVASVNGQEMSPSEMMEAFMGGREFYDNIENTDRATGTFIHVLGLIGEELVNPLECKLVIQFMLGLNGMEIKFLRLHIFLTQQSM